MAAPVGNTYATRARIWREAIECAIEAWPNEPTYVDCSGLVAGMRRAAHAFVAKMMAEKDAAFFKEFGDRIEGKSPQGIELAGPNGGPVAISTIERVIVDPRQT